MPFSSVPSLKHSHQLFYAAPHTEWSAKNGWIDEWKGVTECIIIMKTCCWSISVAQRLKSSLLYSFQCYLFAYFSVWRNSKSFLAFALICLSNMYLYELRNMWQILFHVAVGAFMTLQIRLRQPMGKAPDYTVWQRPMRQRTNGPLVRLEILDT